MRTVFIDWNMSRKGGRLWTVEDDPMPLGERVLCCSGDDNDYLTCEATVVGCRPAPASPEHSYIELQLDQGTWYTP